MVARLVLAAPSSGAGKTTVATGLMAAWTARGLAVSPHKVGPDYIDPGYHALATGRPGRNLDPVLVGEELVAPLFVHGAAGADVAVVEGVMGMYDGRGSSTFGSTAHVARLLSAPVVLVVDASAQSRSVAALVHGFSTYDPSVVLAGVVLNRVASDRHEQLLREALAGALPVLGVLRRDDAVATPSRHLGLVPVAERAPEAVSTVTRLGELAAESLDLGGLLAVARAAPRMTEAPWLSRSAPRPPTAPGPTATRPTVTRPTVTGLTGNAGRPVVAIAGGPAFSFSYAETSELLAAAGADVVTVDPLRDERLPPRTAGLLIGGGFPEVYAEQLSANAPLRADVAALARSGAPVSAECAGLLYLCDALDGAAMCGVLRATGRMTDRLTLGYRDARGHGRDVEGGAAGAGPAAGSWMGPGAVRGHEFHRTVIDPGCGPAPAWHLGADPSAPGAAAARQGPGRGQAAGSAEGWVQDGVHASYLHLHWAGVPGVADRFVAAASRVGVAA